MKNRPLQQQINELNYKIEKEYVSKSTIQSMEVLFSCMIFSALGFGVFLFLTLVCAVYYGGNPTFSEHFLTIFCALVSTLCGFITIALTGEDFE